MAVIFLSFQLGSFQHRRKKHKQVRSFTGSVYSAFCRCKHGADQDCRHLGVTFVWTRWFSFISKKVCHFYVCILDPQTNTLFQKWKFPKAILGKRKGNSPPLMIPELIHLILGLWNKEGKQLSKKLRKIDLLLWYSWFFYHFQKTLMIMKTVHNSLKIIFHICMYYLKLISRYGPL